MKLIRAIPTFGAILVIYLLTLLVVVALSGDPSTLGDDSEGPRVLPQRNVAEELMAFRLFAFELPSKVDCEVTIGHIIVSIGLLFLAVEIAKSTSASDIAITEHVLSTFVFIFYLLCFLLVELAGNFTFALLGLMSLIDVIAGVTISISVARKDISVG